MYGGSVPYNVMYLKGNITEKKIVTLNLKGHIPICRKIFISNSHAFTQQTAV